MNTRTLCITMILWAHSIVLTYPAVAATYPSKYDVVYDRISIAVDPSSSSAITGTVTTWFKLTTPSLPVIGFDLDQNMNVSSVTYHGAALSAAQYSHASNVLLVTFPSPISGNGTLDSVTISYSGSPVTPATNIPSGYNWVTHNGAYMIYTLGEAFTNHTWWPCKDSLTDKIDSLDMIVTTPSGYKVGGNGVASEVISGSSKITTWKTRYPIATYMVNFSVANYQDYAFTVSTGISAPVSLPIHNYLFPEGNTGANQSTLSSIQNILPAYVSLLNTDYPFLNEKYGTAECTNFGGALEVQSMTFVASGAYSTSILAHELSHQWFGDRLTTNDWHQIWLNEGFAEFFQEVIYPEQLQSGATAQSSRQSLKNSVTSTSTTYVPNISNVDNIFIPSAGLAQPYEKGAMTLSMLRAWLGDTRFYTALHNYLNAPGLAYNFTAVDSLKYYMQAQVASLGFDLTNFFNDWVNKKGRVTYQVSYQYVPNGIYLSLTQSPTASGAGYFDMPVPIEIKGPGLDTTVVIIDSRGTLYNSATGASTGNIIHYNLSATPNSLTFDPNGAVLATATMSPSTVLPILDISLSATQGVPGSGEVLVGWDIRTDMPLDSIVIERADASGAFMSVNRRAALAVLPGRFQGNWRDSQGSDGQVYYRLKLILKDGSFDYSEVRAVTGAQAAGLPMIAPNPVEGYCNIRLPAGFGEGKDIGLVLYNTAGQQIRQQTVQGNLDNILSVDCHDLVPGLYWIVLFNDKRQKLSGAIVKK